MRELARRAGISVATISDVESNKVNIGATACVGVARAFSLPPEQVFRRAGILPDKGDVNEDEEEALYLLRQLPPDRRAYIMVTLRALVFGAPISEASTE